MGVSLQSVLHHKDPLQLQTDQSGLSLGGLDPSQLEADVQAALANGADVPKRVQDGPTCGLYALGMAMDHFAQKDPKALTPLVQAADAHRANSHTLPPNTSATLLDTAKKDGFTTQGEMFYASNEAKLANQFGHDATLEALNKQGLNAALDRHHPVLVPFDVDFKGNPGLYNGARAHWADVEGHFQAGGTDYVVATHGWEGKTYVWREDDLLRSSDNMHVPDFAGAPADIHQTLADQMVEVKD